MPDFWKSAGYHLLERNAQGWLNVTPRFLRAYFLRPEVHPIDNSCDAEIRLHEELMDDPTRSVGEDRIARLADKDAADSYRVVLAFRDLLVRAGSIESAYLTLIDSGHVSLPPVFLDQMVHVILRNALQDISDAMCLKAAELFFREQNVSTDQQRLLLADAETVDMHAASNRSSGIAQLLAATGAPMRQVTLDVLDDANKSIYWDRSERFDTVIDFRFGQPAIDAFARVIEVWLAHLKRLTVRVRPVAEINDSDWRWHIGLDRESTRILNLLYQGSDPSSDDLSLIAGLFRMELADEDLVIDKVRGHPIHLGLAMTADKKVRMKPQNLIANLPLRSAD